MHTYKLKSIKRFVFFFIVVEMVYFTFNRSLEYIFKGALNWLQYPLSPKHLYFLLQADLHGKCNTKLGFFFTPTGHIMLPLENTDEVCGVMQMAFCFGTNGNEVIFSLSFII